MSGSGGSWRGSRGLPFALVIALVAALALAVILLSYMALAGVGHNNAEGLPAKPGAPTELPTFTESDPATDDAIDPTDAAEPSPEPEPISLAVPTRQIAAIDEATLVRAEVGSCDAPGSVEFSSDGGVTWSLSESFAQAGATQILRILPTRANLIQVVALDADCDPLIYRTENQGGTWLSPISAVGAWYLDPADPERIGGPDGVLDLPCTALSLVATADRAAAICDDSTVIETADRGFSWSEPAEVEGILAIGLSDDGYVAALGADDSCDGARVASLTPGGLGAEAECYEADLSTDALDAGGIALVQVGDQISLWLGPRYESSVGNRGM